MKRSVERTHRGIAAASVIVLVLIPASKSALAQESCARLIAAATDAYSNGQLEAVLEQTRTCLARRPSSSERESVLMLQARAFLALDDMAQAEAAVRGLLQVNPEFTPAVDDPERFRTLVMSIRRELAREGVSSVSKMTESVPEAPATVIVVTGEQIRQRGYQDLEAVLHDLPGFDISRINGQSYSNVYQRGYRSNATNRTLFLVDGVEQNDLHSNIAYISRQYPLSNIDRIEVVYGPASTMYGANAFLGVINVLTLDPDDMLTEGKALAADVRVGGGSWNTKSIDGTVAGRFRRASFSFTGRLFRSDEQDLSGFDEWKYDYEKRYLSISEEAFTFLSGKQVDPRAEARRLDGQALQSLNGTALGYSDLTDDWMISGKLKINDFLFGLQMWRIREGAASASTQWAEPGALNGNVWSPGQTSLYVRYSTPLSGNLRLSYFGQAKIHELHPDSSAFLLQSYVTGPLGYSDIEDETPAFWAQTRLAQSSNQWRNELNVLYRPRSNLSVLGGIDLRYGSLQMDYSKSSNCNVVDQEQVKVSPNFDPLTMLNGDWVNMSVEDRLAYYWPVVLGIYEQAPKFLEWASDRATCRQTPGQTLEEPTDGGEHMAERDVGVFGQASFNPSPNVKLVAAWRLDHGDVNVNVGRSYGTVATPRLAFIYSPRQFVFKAIYAEAFKDPAPLERFSSVPPGIRDPAENLEPERVNSIEGSASHQGVSHSLDVSVYRASYKHVIGLGAQSLYSSLNGDFSRFSDRFAEEWYFTTCGLETCFINALGQVTDPDDRRELVKQFFNTPVFKRAYNNSASLNVWGSQVNAGWRTRGMELFGNYTYTHPEFSEGSSGALQVGAIAAHQGTLGIGGGWRNLSGSLRVNIAGARSLEPPSRGLSEYLATQGSRHRYAEPLANLSASSRQIDPYAIANLAVTYQFAPGWAVQATINNIFNTSYANPGIQDADNERFAAQVPQPKRSAFIRLLTRF